MCLVNSLVILLAFSSGYSNSYKNTRYVDALQVNTRLNDDGSEGYTQVIAWNWNSEYNRSEAIMYVMIDSKTPDWPKKIGLYYVFSYKDYYGVSRTLKSKILYPHVKGLDLERENKKVLKEEDRIKIW